MPLQRRSLKPLGSACWHGSTKHHQNKNDIGRHHRHRRGRHSVRNPFGMLHCVCYCACFTQPALMSRCSYSNGQRTNSHCSSTGSPSSPNCVHSRVYVPCFNQSYPGERPLSEIPTYIRPLPHFPCSSFYYPVVSSPPLHPSFAAHRTKPLLRTTSSRSPCLQVLFSDQYFRPIQANILNSIRFTFEQI
jgi:hypothetical protein